MSQFRESNGNDVDTSRLSPIEQARAQAPDGPIRRKSLAARWGHASMKLIRRVHLYSGLFMFPWVLMYGVTGMFFNHPRAFNGGTVHTFRLDQSGSEKLNNLASPTQTAEDLVAAINAANSDTNPRVELTDRRPAEFTRHFTFQIDAGNVRHTVTIDPIAGTGEVRTLPAEAPPPEEHDPLATLSPVTPKQNPLTEVEAALPEILNRLDLPTGSVTSGKLAPSVAFSANIDGVPYVINYGLSNGELAASAETKQLPLDTKSFLQRLHLSRGYTPHWGIASLWGVMVDAMFFSMVFWGVSGLLMWWQIKKTRWLGVGCVVASIAATTLLVAGMHDHLTFASGRGSPPAVGRNHGPDTAGGNSGQPASVEGESTGRRGFGRGRGMRGDRPSAEALDKARPERADF